MERVSTRRVIGTGEFLALTIFVEYLGQSDSGCLSPARNTDFHVPSPSSSSKHTQYLTKDAEKSGEGEKESPPYKSTQNGTLPLPRRIVVR